MSSTVPDRPYQPREAPGTATDAAAPAIYPGIFLAVFLAACFQPCSTDIFWHVEIGRRFWHTARIIHRNLFSWTWPDHPWIPTYWLFEVLVYPLYAAAGSTGLVLFRAGLIAAAWARLAAHYERRGLHRGFLYLFTLAAVDVSLFRFLLRPHLFTYLGLAILIPLLDRLFPKTLSPEDKRKPPAAFVPLLFLLWANLHSGVIFGFIYFGIFAAEAALSVFRECEPGTALTVRLGALLRTPVVRRLFLLGFASLGACLINPTGWGFLKYLYDHLTMDQVIPIQELAPYHPLQHPRITFALSLMLFLPPLVSLRLGGLGLGTILRTTFATLLVLKGIRFVPIAALFSFPGMAAAALTVQRHLATTSKLPRQALPSGLRRSLPWLAWGAVPLLYAAHVHLQVYRLPRSLFHSGFGLSREAFPLTAAEKLPRRLDAGLYNSFSTGGYIIGHFRGRVHVFQDGRIHAYPLSFFRRIVPESSTCAGCRRLLARYRIRWVLLRKTEDPVMETVIRTSRQWIILADDAFFLTAVQREGHRSTFE